MGRQELDAFSSLVDTARFLLDGATEAEFDSRREALVTAINEFYDERLAFVNTLDLSDTDRENMREVVRIQRRVALEAIPQMHESVEERLELEQDLQDEIADLRDEEIENEAERQAKITELHEDAARKREEIEEDHQEKLEDIRRKATQSREDVEREFGRDIEDILREAGADESLFSHGDFREIVRLAQTPNQQYLKEALSRRGIRLSGDDFSRIGELARERVRDNQDIGIRTQRERDNAQLRQARALEDLVARTEQREADINAQAEANATALTEALTPLLGEQSALSTAATAQTKAAEKQDTAADKMDTVATKQDTAAEKTDTAAEKLDTAAETIIDSDVPGAIDLVRKSAEASLRITDAIEDLPGILSGQLEESFDTIFDNLQETITELFQIRAGIQSGVGGFLLNTLIESEGRAVGIVGQTAAFALQSLGINPEQFAPSGGTAETASAIEQLTNVESPIPVEVTNSDEITPTPSLAALQTEIEGCV